MQLFETSKVLFDEVSCLTQQNVRPKSILLIILNIGLHLRAIIISLADYVNSL